MCLADFQDWLDYKLPPPPPSSLYKHVLHIYALQAQFHKHRRGKGVELNMMSPHLSKIREKYIKKILRIVIDYRCVQPVLSKNPTCVIPVSNF
jgi:hypothetical protein